MLWLSTICVLDAVLGSEVGNRSFRTLPVSTLCALPNGGVGGTLASASATCRGLRPSVLDFLPVLIFAAAPGCDEDVVECAVCLNELEEGEKMRALPRCGHCFHMECIDMWFHSHSTCPLCRTAVEAAPPPPCVDGLHLIWGKWYDVSEHSE
ncbi:E3 ubiquitin-protein ligase EL5-like [Musa acuminata AAA Group]|uniref:E3 ubiquitin-protein ligase EL5-like n=1 Tax=Musa acuminata AAA Group TaxID=214697 RepID=UPI0031D69A6F